MMGPAVLILCALICRIVYNIIGSEVLADGTLVEPFYLVAIGSLLTLIGLIWFMLNMILFVINKFKSEVA